MSQEGGGWLQVSVILAAEDCARAEACLEDLGAAAITLLDAEDQPILEPAPGATPLWQRVQVRGLFDAGYDAESLRRHLRNSLGEQVAIGAEWLADQCWERAWMAHFKPMGFGRRLWIKPSGYERPAGAEVVLELDPGLAFGTGTHPTTRLCLQWLDACDLNGLRVLDFGCGSGILAIAALALGARAAVATDIDPQALEASAANAARNQVQDRLRLALPDQLPEGRYDLVLANILAGPLIALAPQLIAALGAEGRLVLSGLLAEQVASVREAYAGALVFDPPWLLDGWACLSGRRLP